VLSRKLSNTLVKGWRLDISMGLALDDDVVEKIGLASLKGNSNSLLKLIDPHRRNIPCLSHHPPL